MASQTVADGEVAKRTKRGRPDAARSRRDEDLVVVVNWAEYAGVGRALRETYYLGYAFPERSCEMLERGHLEEFARVATVYHTQETERALAEMMVTRREPCNMGMRRFYDETLLKTRFGYSRGAYEESTRKKLMPNVAVYCRTPIWQGAECDDESERSKRRCVSAMSGMRAVHVVNVVGLAFDSEVQPDYQYFFPLEHGAPKWRELVQRYRCTWRFVFECARRNSLKRIYLADVGGGAFADKLRAEDGVGYEILKKESLEPVLLEYEGQFDVQPLPRMPDFALKAEGSLLEESLFVNAWDPWSMVGNGNAGDHSLDGFFGRSTAMAVLCWPNTNPLIKYEEVQM